MTSHESQGYLYSFRFELPFNIWCAGCGNHVGVGVYCYGYIHFGAVTMAIACLGVRYNAEKTQVGKYYSTPIFQFRMKCHLCDNHFEIRTDPKVSVFQQQTFIHNVYILYHHYYFYVRCLYSNGRLDL